MPKAFVTGAAGFVGSHLCEYFLERDWIVVGLDNVLTGSESNIDSFRERFKDKFVFRRGDATSRMEVAGPFDYVLHFASPASPADFERYAIEILKAGSVGTVHTLDLARKTGARFLLASTSEVYGDPQEHPQKETYFGNVNPVGPRGVYDEAKRFAEAFTMACHRFHGQDTRIVRIFNTYRPRMRVDDHRSVPEFIKRALHNEPILVHGDGSQTRSFCYISDLIEGIFKLLTSARDDLVEPVNIGNPDEIQIVELAKRIIALSGSRSEIVTNIERQPGDPQMRKPDITRARESLNWTPKVPLDQGLQQTIEDFRHRFRGVQ